MGSARYAPCVRSGAKLPTLDMEGVGGDLAATSLRAYPGIQCDKRRGEEGPPGGEGGSCSYLSDSLSGSIVTREEGKRAPGGGGEGLHLPGGSILL